VMSDHCRDTCALWALYSHLAQRVQIAPRLAIRSAVKRCGKTTLLDVLSRLVARPLKSESLTASVVFRVIEAHRPTLLIDEADSFLRDNEELQRVLKSGHRKGGSALRNVGDEHEPRAFDTFSALAIALIGQLPDPLHDRALDIELKRRLRGETVEPFRFDRTPHLDELARKATRWAKDHAEAIADAADPPMPPEIIDREADNWRPLLVIADAAGGEWPQRGRKTALAAHAAAAAAGDQASWIELLLGDIRDTFAQLGAAPAAELFATSADLEIPSKALVETLIAIEGRPWAEMGKSRKPMSQNRLARMLNPLKILPGKVGPEDARLNGYKLSQFREAFDRLLGPEGGSQPDIQTERDEIRTSDISKVDSQDGGCPVEKREKPNNDGVLSTCPVAKGGPGAKTHVRTAGPKSKSDALDYRGPVVAMPEQPPDTLDEHGQLLAATNGNTEGGLTQERRAELAEWRCKWITDGEKPNDVDDALRMMIREELDDPNQVEVEFERVMKVFAV